MWATIPISIWKPLFTYNTLIWLFCQVYLHVPLQNEYCARQWMFIMLPFGHHNVPDNECSKICLWATILHCARHWMLKMLPVGHHNLSVNECAKGTCGPSQCAKQRMFKMLFVGHHNVPDNKCGPQYCVRQWMFKMLPAGHHISNYFFKILHVCQHTMSDNEC